jgi:hypothetical protein
VLGTRRSIDRREWRGRWFVGLWVCGFVGLVGLWGWWVGGLRVGGLRVGGLRVGGWWVDGLRVGGCVDPRFRGDKLDTGR